VDSLYNLLWFFLILYIVADIDEILFESGVKHHNHRLSHGDWKVSPALSTFSLISYTHNFFYMYQHTDFIWLFNIYIYIYMVYIFHLDFIWLFNIYIYIYMVYANTFVDSYGHKIHDLWEWIFEPSQIHTFALRNKVILQRFKLFFILWMWPSDLGAWHKTKRLMLLKNQFLILYNIIKD
jgi:hypothetical protein